jgi:hypothetical protein
MLDSPDAWCPLRAIPDEWMRIDNQEIASIKGVVVTGRGGKHQD